MKSKINFINQGICDLFLFYFIFKYKCEVSILL